MTNMVPDFTRVILSLQVVKHYLILWSSSKREVPASYIFNYKDNSLMLKNMICHDKGWNHNNSFTEAFAFSCELEQTCNLRQILPLEMNYWDTNL